jgi:hypothetical protein
MNRLTKVLATASTSAVVVSGALVALPTASAQQAREPHTRIVVAPRTAKLLGKADVTLTATGGAKVRSYGDSALIRFRISRTEGDGTRIFHTGGIRLENDSASLALKRFRINLNQDKVSAIVDNDARPILFRVRTSHRPALGDARLVFNALSAGTLNTLFDTTRFKAGANFGYADIVT